MGTHCKRIWTVELLSLHWEYSWNSCSNTTPHYTVTDYMNCNSFFGIVLLGIVEIVDTNYWLIYATVGCQGRISDRGVFGNGYFNKMTDDCLLSISTQSPCQEDVNILFIYCCWCFPLNANMKPYTGVQDRGSSKQMCNYIICRAQSCGQRGNNSWTLERNRKMSATTVANDVQQEFTDSFISEEGCAPW